MTAKSRKAIVEYWLYKKYLDLRPQKPRRFYARLCAYFTVFMVYFLAGGTVLAAEMRSTEAAPAASKLTQPKAAAKPVVKPAEKKNKERVKDIEGLVSFIRKNRMAVEFASTDQGSEEMLISIGKEIKLSKAKKLSDIETGDKVKVKFVETYLEPKIKGGEETVLSTVATEIVLLRKAKREPLRSEEAVTL